MPLIEQDALRFNLAVHNANVKTILRFAAAGSASFKSDLFVAKTASLELFPFMSVRELLSAANGAIANIVVKRAELLEVVNQKRPALLVVGRHQSVPFSTELLELFSVKGNVATLLNQDCGVICLELAELQKLYAGFVYFHDDETYDPSRSQPSPTTNIRKESIGGFGANCRKLHQCCEEIGYYSIPSCTPSLAAIGNPSGQLNISYGSALDLSLDQGGAVADLIGLAADFFSSSVDVVEGVHVRRICYGEVIPPRFDNGVNLQRTKAFHILFGADEAALEVTETCSGRELELRVGDAIIIGSADHVCRTDWRSGWSAASVQGDCYIASCWQRWVP